MDSAGNLFIADYVQLPHSPGESRDPRHQHHRRQWEQRLQRRWRYRPPPQASVIPPTWSWTPRGISTSTTAPTTVSARSTAPRGSITTVAGNGTQGYGGDLGQATAANLNHPFAIALDSTGDLFIADTGNNRVREVNLSRGDHYHHRHRHGRLQRRQRRGLRCQP